METIVNLEKQKSKLQEELSSLSQYEKRIKAIRKEMHLIDKAIKQEKVKQRYEPYLEVGKAFVDRVFKTEESYIIIKEITLLDKLYLCNVKFVWIALDFSSVESRTTLEQPYWLPTIPDVLSRSNAIEVTNQEEITKCLNIVKQHEDTETTTSIPH